MTVYSNYRACIVNLFMINNENLLLFQFGYKVKNEQIKSQVRHDSLILKLENKLKQHFIEANERKRKESFKMRNG
jgi:hypothetical protein